MSNLARRLSFGPLFAGLLALSACLPGQPAAPTPAPAVPTTPPAPTREPVTTPAPPSPSPTAPVVPTSTPRVSANKRGVHLLLDDGGSRWPEAVWDDHIQWAARLVGRGGYVVELIRSNDLRPEAWQAFFDTVAREGLIPIVRIATYKDIPNQWWVQPTPDPDGKSFRGEADRLRRFFDAIRWPVPRVFVTVGNEPNRPDEWGGAPDPAAYARYLRDVAEALRKVGGVQVIVLNAALDAFAPSADRPGGSSIDSDRYLEAMAAEEPRIFTIIDGWATHAYALGPFGEHPSRQESKIDDVRANAPPRPPPPSGLPNRGVNGYRWELWKLAQLGVNRSLPVFITETGWRHASTQVVGSLDRDFAVVEDERFAELIALAYDGPSGAAGGWTPWNSDERVVGAALFALAGRADHWGHTNLLLVDPSGRITGAYSFAERLASVGPGAVAPGLVASR